MKRFLGFLSDIQLRYRLAKQLGFADVVAALEASGDGLLLQLH